MNNNKIINVSNGTDGGDAVNKSQLDTKFDKSGGTISGNVSITGTTNFNGQITEGCRELTFQESGRIVDTGGRLWLQSGSSTSDIRFSKFQSSELTLNIDTVAKLSTYYGNINMNNNKIINVSNGTDGGDVVNVNQLNGKMDKSSSSQVITATNNIESNWENRDNNSVLVNTTNSEYSKLSIRNENEGWPSNDGATMIEFQTAMAAPNSGVQSGRIISKSTDGSNFERARMEFWNCYDYSGGGSSGTLEKVFELSNTAQLYKGLGMNNKGTINISALSFDDEITMRTLASKSGKIAIGMGATPANKSNESISIGAFAGQDNQGI
ncbi:MAG: hypothetical protein GY739_17165, partial [Mesoflavibacter sp.]|nr:hypothetical protein [Mesoflavibacter sp.]